MIRISNDDLYRVRNNLSANLPWSPLDFIPGISIEGDKKIFVERLTAELEEDNDLRFVSKSRQGQDLVVFAQRLPWDSDFFGYGVARLDGIFLLTKPYYQPHADYTPSLKKLIDEAKRAKIKYLFAHVDPRDIALLQALGKLSFSVIETRLLYSMSLQDYNHPERYPVRAATANDIDALGLTAKDTINLYDRFHADPAINKQDADRLMYKWVEASILESFADIMIVPDVIHPKAFCSIRYHRDKWSKWNVKLSQVVFTAVGNEYKGWYYKLTSEIHYHLKEIGGEFVYITTQVTNKAVIRVLEKFGYRFGRSELILRIIL